MLVSRVPGTLKSTWIEPINNNDTFLTDILFSGKIRKQNKSHASQKVPFSVRGKRYQKLGNYNFIFYYK